CKKIGIWQEYAANLDFGAVWGARRHPSGREAHQLAASPACSAVGVRRSRLGVRRACLREMLF
ncbi:hypothetical protein A2U01_0098369, partial [Trifolium medium]|nr:hypothetical protein [Trifolium medium]